MLAGVAKACSAVAEGSEQLVTVYVSVVGKNRKEYERCESLLGPFWGGAAAASSAVQCSEQFTLWYGGGGDLSVRALGGEGQLGLVTGAVECARWRNRDIHSSKSGGAGRENSGCRRLSCGGANEAWGRRRVSVLCRLINE